MFIMGQDIRVSAKMRSKTDHIFIALEVNSRVNDSIEDSGCVFKKKMGNVFRKFSETFPKVKFVVETASEREFEADYCFKSQLIEGNYFNQLNKIFEEGDDDFKGDKFTFELRNLYPQSDTYIDIYVSGKSNFIMYEGLNKKEVKTLMVLLQKEFELDYVSSNEFSQVLVKDTWKSDLH